MSDEHIVRATIAHTPSNAFRVDEALRFHHDGALLVRDGLIVDSGDYETVRACAPGAPCLDWRGGVLLPGLVDTHVHFPQVRIVGALGRSLLDWLAAVALPEEARLADAVYAAGVARDGVRALAASGTTTALVFGAHYPEATAAFFEAADASGLRVTTGLCMSDRLLRTELHQSPERAYRDSTDLIRRYHGRHRLSYAVTPRFALSTSEALLEVCQSLVREHDGVRVQTHINESADEVTELHRLFPWARDYLSVYERYGLAGPRTVMAHNVRPEEGELERLAAGRTSVAHCPCSNAALGSGIFPFRRHLDAGVHCALGTDVGGGVGFGILKEALHAHLLQRVAPDPLTLTPVQLLYLSTRAGAEALGLEHEIGDFSPGKAADFVYVRPPDDSAFAAALNRAESPDQVLGAVFACARTDAVREVRVAGAVVHRVAAPGSE